MVLIALSRYATRTRINELVRLTANDDRLLNKGRRADVASGIAVYGPLRMRLFDCRPNLIGVCNVKTTVRLVWSLSRRFVDLLSQTSLTVFAASAAAILLELSVFRNRTKCIVEHHQRRHARFHQSTANLLLIC